MNFTTKTSTSTSTFPKDTVQLLGTTFSGESPKKLKIFFGDGKCVTVKDGMKVKVKIVSSEVSGYLRTYGLPFDQDEVYITGVNRESHLIEVFGHSWERFSTGKFELVSVEVEVEVEVE
jgi:hypothetical protein